MSRHLLLAATLGALAILPAPASAHGHDHNVVPSLDFRIVVRDGPKVVHHHQPPRRYLKPQPWPPRFTYYAPRPRWHQPWWHQPRWHQPWPRHTRDYRFRDDDDRHHFKRGHHKGWRDHRFSSRHHR